jgi:signal peptidase I
MTEQRPFAPRQNSGEPVGLPPAPHHTAPQPVHTPGQPHHTPRERKNDDTWHSIVSTVLVLVLAPLIAIFLTMFVFQSYQVDGPSMETTLHNNDRLIVWKLPRSWSRITGHVYIPKRGDVVVFTDSRLGQFGQDPDKQLIKRIVGLPGEKVVVSGGDVTIYNTAHPNGFDPDKTLPYGKVIPTTPIEGSWTVGKGQVFVMGDNRGNSLDSRLFGPVDAHKIIGKLVVRVLPINTMKRF